MAHKSGRRIVDVGNVDDDAGNLIRAALWPAVVRHLNGEFDAGHEFPVQGRQSPHGARVGIDGKELPRPGLDNIVRKERVDAGIAILGGHDERSRSEALED